MAKKKVQHIESSVFVFLLFSSTYVYILFLFRLSTSYIYLFNFFFSVLLFGLSAKKQSDNKRHPVMSEQKRNENYFEKCLLLLFFFLFGERKRNETNRISKIFLSVVSFG